MISFFPESWFPKKRNINFHAPDRWWISPRIIHFLLYIHCEIQSFTYFAGNSIPINAGVPHL